ncbi:hypothetical protein CEE44_02485 [Candidatus Woesearchaeota archaeon B3_Woes]|nr:MAG: hypothetical protein CEE44_02485 [Candidatus Woesearchaeota archaeon B3_Woes]
MVNKKRGIVLILVIFVIIIVALLITLPKKIVYSKDPQDWIEEEGITNIIDVKHATEGNGYFNTNNQQYKYLQVNTAFGYDGFYKGAFFKNKYIDSSNQLHIEITPNLNPNDGILQGIIVEKFENGKPISYIFLDEDWRKQFNDNINIVWGQTYQNFKKFEFNQISTGVYMDKVEDDSDRFFEDFNIHVGGVLVGDLKVFGENISQIEEENVTLIAIH